jgi:hypothetical protein
MDQPQIEELIRQAAKPAKKPERDPLDAMLKLSSVAIGAVTLMALTVVIVTQAV